MFDRSKTIAVFAGKKIGGKNEVVHWSGFDASHFPKAARANAHLIAAAPEMLEALRAVVAVADRKTDEFDLARAAIAKATMQKRK